MKIIGNAGRVPVYMWAEAVDEKAMEQVRNIARLKCAFHHVAIMPDCHVGFGMPIGGVLATAGTVIPNAVGVDIGCGMGAVRTSLTELGREELKTILGILRYRIPLGFNHHKQPQAWDGFAKAPDVPVIREQLESARCQLGTLGGGNHFIEVQQGSDGFIWLMLHSGSRNFGKRIADEYHARALSFCRHNYEELPSTELAFLPLESDDAREYLAAMKFALDFAQANRDRMMEVFCDAVLEVRSSARFDEPINIHHNYAAEEEHFGRPVMVHRKGATSARAGELGIIPGSQGTSSFIVEGKGNPDSFCSCSHGAGRVLGRKQAQRALDLQAEIRRLEERGILHSLRGVHDLDEAAGAYKDIYSVIRQQSDLVEVVTELKPLAVVKG